MEAYMRPILSLPLALLFGCAAQDPSAESRTPAAASVPLGQQVACIDATRIAGKRAENNRTLVIELSGGATFRNDLDEGCPGIARASSFGTLAIDPIETRMCRGDMVRIYDPADVPSGGLKSVPRCRLGMFTRIESRVG
jgi:hypothetical protein